jgi:lysophospholipid acyltransferase (LPLAT)-like uncharacterized protein
MTSSIMGLEKKKRRRTPQWIKSIGRNERLRNVASSVIAAYIWFVYFSGRWTVVGQEHPQGFWDKDEPIILGFWHGRILMMPKCWNTKMSMNVLISNHRDGEMIANAIGKFGIGTIRGSSSKNGNKGGAKALRAMVKATRAGEALGISPDGPSGPCMQVSEGICATARLAGAPILPITFSASRRKVMKSWDRFVIPMPFSRGIILWGEPIFVDKKADADALALYRDQVEQAIMDVTREADLLMGVDPVVPPEDLSAS